MREPTEELFTREMPKNEKMRIFANAPWTIVEDYFGQVAASAPLESAISVLVENVNLTIRLHEGIEGDSQLEENSPVEDELNLLPSDSLTSSGLEIKLTHINLCFETFDTHKLNLASRIRLRVKEMEILDHLGTSTWSKFMTAVVPDLDQRPRETSRDMLKLEFSHFKPPLQESEHRIKVCI